MSQNFAITRAGALQAVTTGNQNIKLSDLFTGVAESLIAAAQDVLIDNRDNVDAYILFGGGDLAVTVNTGVRIPAGSLAVYSKGNALNFAVIGAGLTSLVIHLGQGS